MAQGKGFGDLRVISGRYRGRTLRSPGSEATHPMGAREKLALFNMVNVEGARVLDAFAGSGALGIEALSRGAQEVAFVEASPKIARVIRENLDELGVDSEAFEVFSEKIGRFAEREEHQEYFQVIFADPPYDKVDAGELASLERLLASDGILALSSPKEMGEISLAGLRISSVHTYARARITIYRKAQYGLGRPSGNGHAGTKNR